jgi:hypothetical protein
MVSFRSARSEPAANIPVAAENFHEVTIFNAVLNFVTLIGDASH